jgi:hypothetical protein
MAAEQQDPIFEITTTAQVERTYKVSAPDEAAAHKRLRRFIEDPEMMKPGVVEIVEDLTTDTTPQKVKTDSIKKLPSGPKAVEGGAQAELA